MGNLERRDTILWHLSCDKHGSKRPTHEEIARREALEEEAMLSAHITIEDHSSPPDVVEDATNVDHSRVSNMLDKREDAMQHHQACRHRTVDRWVVLRAHAVVAHPKHVNGRNIERRAKKIQSFLRHVWWTAIDIDNLDYGNWICVGFTHGTAAGKFDAACQLLGLLPAKTPVEFPGNLI
jgi:hypothetical protein